MTTMETISESLNLIDAKKENLKQAFDDLQSQSSSLYSLPFSWLDLDSHFIPLQHSLSNRFRILQSLEQSSSQSQTLFATPNDKTPKFVNFLANPTNPTLNLKGDSSGVFPENYIVSDLVVPRYELCVLCEKMDGVGLRNYVKDHLKDKIRVQAELSGALRCAPDAAELVLESLVGFDKVIGGSKDGEIRKVWKSCIMLLKQLGVAGSSVSFKAREKALKLSMEWKVKLFGDDATSMGALGFLYFVYAFDLVSEFSIDELVHFSVMAAINDRFPELCWSIPLTDIVPEMVQKLIDRGKYTLAVKYVFEFNLADKISPVPILKACVDESKKLAKRLSEEGKSRIEIAAREIHALKSVIKIIENHKLESEYPRASLELRIEQLNGRQGGNMNLQKRPRNRKMKKLKQQQSGIEHHQTFTSVGSVAVLKNVNSTISQYQLPLVNPSGLFLEHPDRYLSSLTMSLGMVVPNSIIPPYTGPYDLAGFPMGPSKTPSLGGSHQNSSDSEPHVPSGCYHRASTYGAINLQYHYQASYYPQ